VSAAAAVAVFQLLLLLLRLLFRLSLLYFRLLLVLVLVLLLFSHVVYTNTCISSQKADTADNQDPGTLYPRVEYATQHPVRHGMHALPGSTRYAVPC
jgi:hypothetical protein